MSTLTQCGICGRMNHIVNECRCDPNNLPTPLPKPGVKQQPVLKAFIGRSQASAIRSAMRGEEGDWFRAKVRDLQTLIDSMPVSYQTEGQEMAEKVASLHYFGPRFDAWIVELDKGHPADEPQDYQTQAFGMVDLGYGPEFGYISIPEMLANGMELDLHWRPKPLGEIREKVGVA